MIWILSVETQRVHRKIFIHYVFTSQNRSGGEKSEFFWVRISANEQQLDHISGVYFWQFLKRFRILLLGFLIFS